MRYLSAPWAALLKDDLWLKNEKTANERTEQLYQAVRGIGALRVLFPRQANSVFVELLELVRK